MDAVDIYTINVRWEEATRCRSGRGRRRSRGVSVFRGMAVIEGLRSGGRCAAGTLSGGQQQMQAIGQPLMQEPSVLLRDEPSSCLAPGVVDVTNDAVGKLAPQGQAVFVVKQNVDRAISAASRISAIEQGTVNWSPWSRVCCEQANITRLVMGVS